MGSNPTLSAKQQKSSCRLSRQISPALPGLAVYPILRKRLFEIVAPAPEIQGVATKSTGWFEAAIPQLIPFPDRFYLFQNENHLVRHTRFRGYDENLVAPHSDIRSGIIVGP
ncbi:MAG: hypothetical protein LM550_13980 [Candidatus Contendobacter sp.]|nr:hypothetical protein [Gammaproteobacteria bacterium]MCC8994761.1 hypothetical protein [Candidatus Contendobacter sp.]